MSTTAESRRKRSIITLSLVLPMAVFCAACSGDATTYILSEQQALEGDFVPVTKSLSWRAAANPASGLVGMPEGDGDFYLAIKKSAFEERWFLSAYLKQFYPNTLSDSALSFGTRVVSFEAQNDRLFMFDASELHKGSEIVDPTLLIEAYPIVTLEEFERLPRSDEYVLIDPARGQNEFSLASNVYRDPYLGQPNVSLPLRVGLAFSQNFEKLRDGATFEQVFAGEVTGLDGWLFDVWGTLGIDLRRYSEGGGYVPTADPGQRFYFASNERIVPDSALAIETNPMRWNFRRGMSPQRVYVTAGAQRAQADFPEVDVLGAIERGIESWNEAFGFEALQAVFVDDDRIRDPDETFVLVDYPGIGLPYAFAQSWANPNNGEIRGASVFLAGTVFEFSAFADDAVETVRVPEPAPAPPFELVWGDTIASHPRCRLEPSGRGLASDGEADALAGLTANEKASRYVQHMVAHEIGHTLGLRHNFKASLLPPASSVMDYYDNETRSQVPTPGPYDVDALRYLYQLSDSPPSQPFCTDEDMLYDPLCAQWDQGAEPLTDWWIPNYTPVLDAIIDQDLPVEWLDFWLNELLTFARDDVATGSVDPSDRVAALRAVLGRAGVPVSAEDAALPAAVAAIDTVAQYVLRRVALDDPTARGPIPFDLTDPSVVAVLSEQVGGMIRNVDGVRSFSLRRTGVDVLKALQDDRALRELGASRDALQAELSAATVPPEDVPLVEDLLARIAAAMAPYYQ
jgi:hypothetical protein